MYIIVLMRDASLHFAVLCCALLCSAVLWCAGGFKDSFTSYSRTNNSGGFMTVGDAVKLLRDFGYVDSLGHPPVISDEDRH